MKQIIILILWLLAGLGITFLIGFNQEVEGTLLILEHYYYFGFPLQFAKICDGNCVTEPSVIFNYFYFLIDYLFWLVVIYCIFRVSKDLWKSPQDKKNWKIILLIIGVTILVVSNIFSLIFPYGWKYIKCPPLSCDYRQPFGYQENPLYLIINSLAILLIIIATTFLLAQFVSRKFYKITDKK